MKLRHPILTPLLWATLLLLMAGTFAMLFFAVRAFAIGNTMHAVSLTIMGAVGIACCGLNVAAVDFIESYE